MEIGLTLQLNWIVKGFANVWLGRLSDLYGRRVVIIISFIAYVAGTVVCGFSQSIVPFLIARLVQVCASMSKCVRWECACCLGDGECL